LGIDRSGKHDKDSLIDALLDFLGAPAADMLKGQNKATSSSKATTKAKGKKRKQPPQETNKEKAKTSKKKAKAKKEDEDEEEEEENDDEVASDNASAYEQPSKGKMPNDNQLRQWVKAFVQCYNMDKVSIKVALEVAGDKFGVDLAHKKDLLKVMLTEEL
jgi:hypothetical protein